jgi:hypothetical protein
MDSRRSDYPVGTGLRHALRGKFVLRRLSISIRSLCGMEMPAAQGTSTRLLDVAIMVLLDRDVIVIAAELNTAEGWGVL